jgi:hypothetical protein
MMAAARTSRAARGRHSVSAEIVAWTFRAMLKRRTDESRRRMRVAQVDGRQPRIEAAEGTGVAVDASTRQ